MYNDLAAWTLATLLALAGWRDVKHREIEVWIFAAMAPPAAYLVLASWQDPVYQLQFMLGAVYALALVYIRAGAGDILAALAAAAAGATLTVFLLTATLIALTPLWLYALNTRRPCPMSRRERATYICIRRGEFGKYGVEAEGEWAKARYGPPYVAWIAAAVCVTYIYHCCV
ncbi:MAG: hypothetical protein ACK4SY_07150 [Pyrobaculum sp.]